MPTITKTHTGRRNANYQSVIVRLLSKTGMHYDTWCELVLEYGCQYLWRNYSYADAREIMTNPEYNFWSNWLKDWLDDDEYILERFAGYPVSANHYESDKKEYLNCLPFNNEKV